MEWLVDVLVAIVGVLAGVVLDHAVCAGPVCCSEGIDIDVVQE